MISRPISEVYSRQILLEYSEGFIKAQVERLKRSAGVHVEEPAIRAYIERFDQLKSGSTKNQIIQLARQFIDNGQIAADPRFGPKDEARIKKLKENPLQIEFYNWNDLEMVKDSFRDPAEKKAQKASNPEDTGAEEIYNQNNLSIYWGADMNQCIKFKHWIVNKTAKALEAAKRAGKTHGGHRSDPYGWCISYPQQNNMFARYRFGAGESDASVYFVIDWDREMWDGKCVIVIHAQRNGKYRLTNAYNDEEVVADWNTAIQWQPKLKGLQGLLTFKPFTEAEELYKVTKDATPKDFKNFTRYTVKRAYIGAGKPIDSEDYLKLPTELQHLYVNVRCPTPDNDNLNLLLYGLFADTDITRIESAIKEVRTLSKQGATDYQEPILREPTLMQGDQQTYKYYRKLVNDAIEARGTRKKA